MRRKELRLALICYGGVSLAVYMHGITREVWKLARASMRRHHHNPESLAPASDSEAVYADLLAALEPNARLMVTTDIIAGASAGGINGILLAQAITTGQSLDPLRDLWLEGADSDRLLDPRAASRPTSKLWALPLVEWTRRRGLDLGDTEEPDVRSEAAARLSRLMRSRWFDPPFSGPGFSAQLLDALAAMASGPATPPLLPDQQTLDLFVTVTDYHGAEVQLPLHSPAAIRETDHRLVIGFRSAAGPARHLADHPELAFAARATASFPGAFPPATVAEIDALLAERGQDWPGRSGFLARLFPGRAAPDHVPLIDGSVINGRPFGPAIEALARHRAHREVDRRFVYIDPHPGQRSVQAAPGQPEATPGFFATILRSLADIPRQQPINDSLATIEALSARVRSLREVTDGMAPEVEAAIEAAVGRRVFLFRITPQRLAEWRSKGQSAAAERAGFSYAGYARLKLARLVDLLAQIFSALEAGPMPAVRERLHTHLAQIGIIEPGQLLGRGGAGSPFVGFLRRFDVDFRVRRLRFLIRRINARLAAGVPQAEVSPLDQLKSGLYELLDAHLARRTPAPEPALVAAAAGFSKAPGAALAALEALFDLKALDARSDAAFAALLSGTMPRGLRRWLLNLYLGFPFYDVATLALLAGDGSDEFDEIKVDRLSPLDAPMLASEGGTALKGARLSAFGAFFSRAYREHDYLWGRLHAAERLIDIIGSAVPSPPDLVPFKARALAAIIAAERPHLHRSQDLLDRLAAALEQAASASSDAGSAQ
jgi:patatin-related protein